MNILITYLVFNKHFDIFGAMSFKPWAMLYISREISTIVGTFDLVNRNYLLQMNINT